MDFLRAALDTAPDGVVVCEAHPPDYPLVYANAAFCRMSGYSLEELQGQDLRRLQSWDREQEARTRLRGRLSQGESCRVLLRNYRKDGSQFWNELLVQPLRSPTEGAADPGRITHYIGYCHDVSERERSAARRAPILASRAPEDRLSGLHTRAHFEELLQHDWQIGLRERRVLSVLAFDINELGSYNDTFGRAAGDACIRRVAGVISASFRRGSDVVARWEGGGIVAMIRSSDPAALPEFAGAIAQRVLEQHIHHPRAQRQKFVTISVGAASVEPTGERLPQSLVEGALRALRRAKQDQKSHVAVAVAGEIA
jgi:diguanylate cyclase (GGDEF)-like protein/PAS domain S-box-containing protein